MVQRDNSLASSAFPIRFGTLNDAAALASLGAKTFHDTFAGFNSEQDMQLYLEKHFTLDQVQQELADPANTFLLAQDGDTIIGYAKLRRSESPEELGTASALEIERIYSIKDYHGKQVGKALMLGSLSVAQSENFEIIWLGVWEHNPRAIAFYEKWGFEKFGAHSFMLGTDEQKDLLMRKKLR